MDSQFVAQFRSWEIMDRYFGIKQPGAVSVPLPMILTPKDEKTLQDIREKAEKLWEEKAKLN